MKAEVNHCYNSSNNEVINMNVYDNITQTAKLISDATRMSMLMELSGMHSLTAKELAKSAKVSPQTASSHLKKLIEGNLIISRKQGRHKYYQLASENVAQAIESIANISGPLVANSLSSTSKKKKLEFARTCYGHLAGELGVAITEGLIKKGYLLESDSTYYKLTKYGKIWFENLGINISNLNIQTDYLALHIDWTMRKNHLAGPLSLALTKHFLNSGWIKEGNMKREIILTRCGEAFLYKELGINL